MATIKEIAELAGVSRGTVDRVLNNRGSVNDATAEKILEIAKALDYRPNRAGIVLAAQKKRLKLGVILFSAGNPFFEDVLKGVTEKAEELSAYNCSIVVKQVHFNIEEQLAAIDELTAEEVNVVTFNPDIEGSRRIAYVGSHYTHSGETAAGLMHLMTFGKVRLGIISGSHDILCHTERIAGFKKAVQERYSNIQIVETIENHDDEIESYEKTTALLTAHPDINALFFAAGGVYGGCRAVLSMGLQDKIRILAFDKVPSTKVLVEEGVIAATICQQPKIQGTKPLDILFAFLTAGEIPEKEHHYVAIDIRIKENIH